MSRTNPYRRYARARHPGEHIPVVLAAIGGLVLVAIAANSLLSPGQRLVPVPPPPAREEPSGARTEPPQRQEAPPPPALPAWPAAAALPPESPPEPAPPTALDLPCILAIAGPRQAKLELATRNPLPAALSAALAAWRPPQAARAETPVTVERTTQACALRGNPQVTLVLLRGRGLGDGRAPGRAVVFFGPYVNESEDGICGDPVNRALVDTCPVAILSVVVRGQRQDEAPEQYYSDPAGGLYPAIERGLGWANARIDRPAATPVLAWGESAGASLVAGLVDAFPGRFATAAMLGGDRFGAAPVDRRAERIFLSTRGDHNWANATAHLSGCRAAGIPGLEAHVFPPNPWQRGHTHYHHSPGAQAHRYIVERLRRAAVPAAARPAPAPEDAASRVLRTGFAPARDPAEDAAPPGGVLDDVPECGPRRADAGQVQLAIRRRGAVAGLVVYLPPRAMAPSEPVRDNLLRLAELGCAAIWPDSGCGPEGLDALLAAVASADPALPVLVVVDGFNARSPDPAWLGRMLAPMAGLPTVALAQDPGHPPLPPTPPADLAVLAAITADADAANLAFADLLPVLLRGWRR